MGKKIDKKDHKYMFIHQMFDGIAIKDYQVSKKRFNV